MGQIDQLNYQSIRKQSEWLFRPSLILLSIDYKIMGQIDLQLIDNEETVRMAIVVQL